MLGGSSEIDKNFKVRMEAFDAAADTTRFKMLAKAAGAADAAAAGGRKSIGTDRVPIFDRPVSGRETLSQLVFVLACRTAIHNSRVPVANVSHPPGGWFIGRFMATGVGLLAKQWPLLGVSH